MPCAGVAGTLGQVVHVDAVPDHDDVQRRNHPEVALAEVAAGGGNRGRLTENAGHPQDGSQPGKMTARRARCAHRRVRPSPIRHARRRRGATRTSGTVAAEKCYTMVRLDAFEGRIPEPGRRCRTGVLRCCRKIGSNKAQRILCRPGFYVYKTTQTRCT